MKQIYVLPIQGAAIKNRPNFHRATKDEFNLTLSFQGFIPKLPLRERFYFICYNIHILHISSKIFLGEEVLEHSLANVPIIKMPFYADARRSFLASK